MYRSPHYAPCWPISILAAIVFALPTSSVHAATSAFSFEPVALNRTTLPGGNAYASFSTPIVNDVGQLAFVASGGNDAERTQEIFVGSPGELRNVARTGTKAPLGGDYAVLRGDFALNNSGQVGFLATLTNGSSTEGIFLASQDGVEVVALNRTQSLSGKTISGFATKPQLNDAGQVAIRAIFGANSSGIYVGQPGNLNAYAVTGGLSPSGIPFQFFPADYLLNERGQVAFQALLGGDSFQRGIFIAEPGGLETVALSGVEGPTGAMIYDFNRLLAFEDSGRIAFSADMQGQPVGAFIIGQLGALELVAAVGDPTPAGGTFAGFLYNSDMKANSAGEVALHSRLEGARSDFGLFAGDPGNLKTIALVGDPAPEGLVFSKFHGAPYINDRGQAVFLADVAGPNVSILNDTGVYLWTGNTVTKIIRQGEQIDIDPTAAVKLRTVSFDGIDASRMATDYLGLGLTFTGGEAGVFRVNIGAIPEPSTATLAALLGWVVFVRGRSMSARLMQ